MKKEKYMHLPRVSTKDGCTCGPTNQQVHLIRCVNSAKIFEKRELEDKTEQKTQEQN